jgi:hypothetical protein
MIMQSHGPNSNFFLPRTDGCCWIEDNNDLLVIYTPCSETSETKFYQNYYPKLRRNIGVGVLTDQILTARMTVPGMEPAYASGGETPVLTHYI